jgi:hypothetical protein
MYISGLASVYIKTMLLGAEVLEGGEGLEAQDILKEI